MLCYRGLYLLQCPATSLIPSMETPLRNSMTSLMIPPPQVHTKTCIYYPFISDTLPPSKFLLLVCGCGWSSAFCVRPCTGCHTTRQLALLWLITSGKANCSHRVFWLFEHIHYVNMKNSLLFFSPVWHNLLAQVNRCCKSKHLCFPMCFSFSVEDFFCKCFSISMMKHVQAHFYCPLSNNICAVINYTIH